MPRFTARPSYAVEAYQYQGNTLNMEGAFNAAFTNFQPGGPATVRTEYGLAIIHLGDWLVRGSDGVVAPVRANVFEEMYEPAGQALKERKTRNAQHQEAG